MAKKNNNLNLSIFSVLKVSEKSGIPVLMLSNPGQGKTSTVQMFADVRGYEVVLLRGNSTSAEEVMGYDVSPRDVTWEKPMSAIHLRPSWFEQVLRNHEANKKSLLFLDELTTANEFVQAALLHLIFERKCGTEKLPEDTMIVSAGNYIGNLSNTMTMLSPVLNRFLIFNLLPDHNDLDIFLNRFEGAIASKDGKCKDYMAEIAAQMVLLDKQEVVMDEKKFNKIGEYIERGIKDTARMLMTTGEKPVDLTVTELSGIYTDTDDTDSRVYGFVTFRTLNYLRDVTVAFYQCFGKAGITSDNYRNAIDGLCGIGVKRDTRKGGDIIKTKIGKEFYDAMSLIVNDIEKMNNSKLPEYEQFFADSVAGKTEFDKPTMQAIINKMAEMKADKELDNIERPIDPDVIGKICEITKKTGTGLTKTKVSSSDKLLDKIPADKFIDTVVKWNMIADLISGVDSFVGDASLKYKEKDKTALRDTIDDLRNAGFKLRSLKKLILQEDKALDSMIPEVKALNSK